MEEETKGKEDLKKVITSNFNRLHHDILSLVQLLTKNEYQYSQVRAQVLRAGNNAQRDILSEIDSYNLEEIPSRRARKETYDVDNKEV